MSTVTLYRVFDGDALLYVGCSMYGAQRLQQHGDKPWWNRASHVTLEHFGSAEAAHRAETEAIASESPEFNVAKAGSRPGRRVKPPATTYRIYCNCSNCGEREGVVVNLGDLFDASAAVCSTCGCRTLVRDGKHSRRAA